MDWLLTLEAIGEENTHPFLRQMLGQALTWAGLETRVGENPYCSPHRLPGAVGEKCRSRLSNRETASKIKEAGTTHRH
jgi:hypothetical protein